MSNQLLTFKIASEMAEFEAIHRLNYQTFVEEIPQHSTNKEQKLVDKFHQHNTYIICLQGEKLLGMLSVNDKRPFSLDSKLSNIDDYLPAFQSICEIRLLSIKAKNRHSVILAGIFKKLFEFISQKKYDLGVISGITKQTKLYQHVGFKAFGPLVGHKNAQYQPMYATFERAIHFKKRLKSLGQNQKVLNYLPGPVSIRKNIVSAYTQAPISHREENFIEDFSNLRHNLCQRLKTKEAYIATGCGTFANDIIAAQLSKITGKGLVLVNGEFGKRLEDHAKRARLDYETHTINEGFAFTKTILKKIDGANNKYRWLWMVHCETSTGAINDLNSIQIWCKKHKILLCLDGISTIGACPTDLTGVYLASASSGKGIGSFPGLALVFSSGLINEYDYLLPRCFDLSYYAQTEGVPYTISSNAVHGLIIALQQNWHIQFETVKKWSFDLCIKIEKMGFKVLASKKCRAPHITTIALPKKVSSLVMGQKMLDAGILISYKSNYLLKNNWVQICLMGDCQQPSDVLIDYLRQVKDDIAF